MLRFTVITLFPEMFSSPLGHSILKKARENGLIRFSTIDPRSYATDRHHTTDDYPYGGGQGMVMKPEPLVAAIEAARSQSSGARVILLTPRGEVFRQATARRLAGEAEIVLVCGRYEGVDERVKELLGTTDGNLSVHARKLEEAHYITCTKSFEGRLPKTVYRLSPAGRAALERYLDHMEALIRATRSAEP